MSKLEVKSYLDLQTGLLNEGAVSEYRMPTDAVTESLNFKFNKVGSAMLRAGTTLLGDAGVLSGNLLGLYEFRDSGAGTNNQIVAVNGTVLYYLSGTTWTSRRSSLTTGYKARFTTFVDFLIMVNGVDATAAWDGNPSNAFVTNGNVASAPIGQFIENFRSRVWIAGNATYPDRLYYSSVPSAVTTPIITWDTSVTTGQWIDISPSDGENITALKRNKTSLLVFKNNHIYRVASITATEPDPVINVGTYCQESVVDAKDGCYFHHPSGFYKYSNGEVTEISKPIIDIIKNITVANYSYVCGWLETDGDNIVWAVGTMTINGVIYTNLEVRYTISTQTWTHYTKPSQALVASRYNTGSALVQLIGDGGGNVLKMDTGLTDNGAGIHYNLISRWYQIDGLSSTMKHLIKLLFVHDKGAGSNVSWQNEDSILNDWKPLVQLESFNTGVRNANIRGRKIRFRISGISTGQPFSYFGFEILEGNVELYV